MTRAELQKESIRIIRESIEKMSQKFGVDIPMPSVEFNLKGTVAGRATYVPSSIRLNMLLLEQNGDKFLKRTPAHEAAHIVVRKVFGRRKPHGPEWKRVMRLLGVESTRCHDYDTDNCGKRKTRKFLYSCGCSNHYLGTAKHKRALSGLKYRCLRCHEVVAFMGKSKIA